MKEDDRGEQGFITLINSASYKKSTTAHGRNTEEFTCVEDGQSQPASRWVLTTAASRCMALKYTNSRTLNHVLFQSIIGIAVIYSYYSYFLLLITKHT